MRTSYFGVQETHLRQYPHISVSANVITIEQAGRSERVGYARAKHNSRDWTVGDATLLLFFSATHAEASIWVTSTLAKAPTSREAFPGNTILAGEWTDQA